MKKINEFLDKVDFKFIELLLFSCIADIPYSIVTTKYNIAFWDRTLLMICSYLMFLFTFLAFRHLAEKK